MNRTSKINKLKMVKTPKIYPLINFTNKMMNNNNNKNNKTNRINNNIKITPKIRKASLSTGNGMRAKKRNLWILTSRHRKTKIRIKSSIFPPFKKPLKFPIIYKMKIIDSKICNKFPIRNYNKSCIRNKTKKTKMTIIRKIKANRSI
uniref:Uncharacterized protein n=1 Tax=Anophryoides haemophila TaxID=46462 RepID=A0A7S3IBE8_9CILI|mmetsp:Transcript_481/g.85  ORF Transcript_481/g.85 Transcript_481/m.85 type:complete len:147 (+) Transcript_481:248-688(+)